MFKFLIQVFFLMIGLFIENIIAYRIIRKIDKKERKKINKFELDHADNLVSKLEIYESIKGDLINDNSNVNNINN